MSKTVVAAKDLAQLIPVSKAISQKLTPEEYSEFVAQVGSLTESLETARTTNETLTAEVTSLTTRATEAESKVSTLENEKLLLSADVESLKPFKAKIEQITASGRQTGAADLSTQNTDTPQSFVPGSADALALASWKKANGIK